MKVRFLFVMSALAACAQQSFIPSVTALPGAPSRILFGTYKGAFVRSNDSGSTWTPVYVTEPGSRQPPINDLEIDLLNNSILYLVTTAPFGGLWKSTDAGATWAKANSGLPANGAPAEFKQVTGPPQALYLREGNQLFRSNDRGANWALQSTLPGSSGSLAIYDTPSNVFYFVDAITLSVYQSLDFGHSWNVTGTLPVPIAPGKITTTTAVIGNLGTNLFVAVNTPGPGAGAYVSNTSGGSFVDGGSVGLGGFTKIDSNPGGPDYAFGVNGIGFYRSDDNGKTWNPIGVTTGVPYTLGAVDPGLRGTIYADRGGSSPAFIKSVDAGLDWTVIPATITPTLAKPTPTINVTVEENAPYSQAFTVQAYEDPSWALPVTLTTTGESWLQLGSTGGTTPLPNRVNINTTGLGPGTYQSSITISSPPSFNQSVTIPVILNVKPAGSLGPQYTVTTAAGTGDASTPLTNGSPTSIGIGGAKALGFDNTGRLLISGGNRIWQVSNNLISPIAGSGQFGSTGDGTDALQANIADPDAVYSDPQGNLYFTEFSTGRIRKILNGAISTVVDLGRLNIQPSHSVLVDSFGRLILVNPTGLLRYDGTKVQTLTAYPMIDPYSMVSDNTGNIFVSDRGANQIVEFAASGAVTVYAGLGAPGYSGDGSAATNALLNSPSGLAIDSQGTLYFADTGNQRIRTITSDGIIHTIAGSGVGGFGGDGSTADFAAFQSPTAVAVDSTGNVFVADSGNNRVRKLALAIAATPKPTAVVHAASGSLQVAPGGLFSVYGDLLAPANGQEQAVPWPKSINQVAVSFNGIFAPLYFVSKGLINGQVPYEVQPGTANVVVTVAGSLPATVQAQVVPANPGLLLFNGRALAVNPDASVNGPDAPASPGSFVILYLSGIGIPDHAVATGAGAPSVEPLARVNYPYTITVNGQPVTVLYLGLAPGFPALAQANIAVPNLPAGDYPVQVTINGVASNSANISIR